MITLEQVRQIAEAGKYNRIPIFKEILSDYYTTIEVLKILKGASKHVYLLESASQEQVFGRYSFLGYEPSAEISCTDGRLRIRRRQESGSKLVTEVDTVVDHPGDAIRELLKEYKSPKLEGLPPFSGGLVGYFSYDYIKYSEPKLQTKNGKKERDKHNKDFRDVDLMVFDQVLAFDHYRQKVIVIAGVDLRNSRRTDQSIDESALQESYQRAENKIKEMIHLIQTGRKKSIQRLEVSTPIQPKYEKDRYCEMVETAKSYIKEGDIFQVVLSNPLTARAEGSLFDTYRALRSENPSPYMFYFSSDDIEIAGASPETLVKVEEGMASTFPLAGTRPRGHSEEEDQLLEQELLVDEKELAEHNMLVDLGRNDMGRISELGTVKVERYLEVQRYSHVMHIGSTVVGQVRADCDAVDVMDAILPAGTLSGAPKFRACQIIEQLERSKRGIYGGAIGYLDFTGNMDTCIAIRLVYKKNGSICIRSGAGIVADSVPEKEYQECINKAQAVVDAIQQAREGLR